MFKLVEDAFQVKLKSPLFPIQPKERVIDMSPEEQKDWEEKQLDGLIDLNNCHIDPAPFQLGELSGRV